MRGVPMMLLYALMYPILLPPGVAHWLALAVSLVLALAVSFAWRFLYSLMAFWSSDAVGIARFASTTGIRNPERMRVSVDAVGIARFASTLTLILSGFLMPVAFMPDWMVMLMRLTPFPAMVNTPIEIYLGIVNGPELLFALLEQAVWTIILLGVARLILASGVRKLVIARAKPGQLTSMSMPPSFCTT
jgi:ABC-2 type transport system permease protein